jgi:hypothetical protein
MARRENEFSGMLKEDPREVANLPQEVIMKSYPKCEYMEYEYDDTIRRVDETIDDSVRTLKKNRSRSMY